MLPFLANKKQKSGTAQDVFVKNREPDEKAPFEGHDDPDAALHACSRDLIDAVMSNKAEKVTQVIKDMFEIMESQPHEEAPHEEGQE